MLLLRPDDLARSLSSFRFDTRLVVRKGEVTAQLAELGVLGFGETTDEAMSDLVVELRTYARRFFERAALYLETERAAHLPWLLRFAMTPEGEQLALLSRDLDPEVSKVG